MFPRRHPPVPKLPRMPPGRYERNSKPSCSPPGPPFLQTTTDALADRAGHPTPRGQAVRQHTRLVAIWMVKIRARATIVLRGPRSPACESRT